MEKLTGQIIMMCKQPQAFGEFSSHREAVITMLALRNGTPISYWKRPESKNTIEQIIHEAALDYLNCCKKPSLFVRDIEECLRINAQCRWTNYNYFDAILSAFSLAQVKDDTGFINGFSEKTTKVPTPDDFKE